MLYNILWEDNSDCTSGCTSEILIKVHPASDISLQKGRQYLKNYWKIGVLEM